jgi:hypothetical protein
MSVENNWYVYRDRQRWGPYTWHQLVEMVRSGKVFPDDQVWNTQYLKKINANQVQELSEFFSSENKEI